MKEMNNSVELERARAYEKQQEHILLRELRPSFHISAPTGWINDPNGFSVYQGEYHLFYQYYPYDTKWGPMHWGHSKTKDFIRWEQLPAALAPDTEYDGQGCFSGSAVEHEGNHILMYTSVLEKTPQDGARLLRQTQSIAIGDGVNYKKLDCNPVITSDSLPKGSSREDFRDPKIWKEEDVFYAVAGSRSEDTSGQIILFSSQDIHHWNYEGIIESCRKEYGAMWECPDFFALDNRQVLIVSPQDMTAKGLEFHNGNNTLYLIGDYDKEKVEFKRTYAEAVDYGLDFYAPQTLEAEDGRRIMIGWMQSWDNHIAPRELGWSGIMSIPRELNLKDGRLIQKPVREIEQYYENKVCYQDITLDGKLELEDLRGRELDMTVEIKGGPDACTEIMLACDETLHTIIKYDARKTEVTFDRTYAGIKKDIIHNRTMKVRDRQGSVKLRILVDKYTVELFANDGEQTMSSLIYTPLEAENICFSSTERVNLNVVKYDVTVK